MRRKSSQNIEGTLIYDPHECKPEELQRVKVVLDSKGIRYDTREMIDVYTEGSIAFEFPNRRASGHYSLEGAREILGFASCPQGIEPN